MPSSLLMLLRRVKWDLESRLDLLREALNQRLSPSHRSIAVGLDQINAFEQCVEWLEEYIAQPHPQLGREGEICPFVRPALEQDKMTFRIYTQITQPSVGELRRILAHEGVAHISHLGPNAASTDLTSLLVMFPRLGLAHGDRLWDAYNGCLEYLNSRGVMLAAFFPGSEQPAQYNPDFHPFQAPFPICALRPMRLRDILFIMNRGGFREYRRRYGARYEAGAIAASTGLPRLYDLAVERFA